MDIKKENTIKILEEIVIKQFISSNNLTDLAYNCPNYMDVFLIELYNFENKPLNDDVELKILKYLDKLYNLNLFCETTSAIGLAFDNLINKFPEVQEYINNHFSKPNFITLKSLRYINDDLQNEYYDEEARKLDIDKLFINIIEPIMTEITHQCIKQYREKNFAYVKDAFDFMENQMGNKAYYLWDTIFANNFMKNLEKKDNKKIILKLVSPKMKKYLNETYDISLYRKIDKFINFLNKDIKFFETFVGAFLFIIFITTIAFATIKFLHR